MAPEVKVIDGTKLSDLQPNQESADTALLDSFFGHLAGANRSVCGRTVIRSCQLSGVG